MRSSDNTKEGLWKHSGYATVWSRVTVSMSKALTIQQARESRGQARDGLRGGRLGDLALRERGRRDRHGAAIPDVRVIGNRTEDLLEITLVIRSILDGHSCSGLVAGHLALGAINGPRPPAPAHPLPWPPGDGVRSVERNAPNQDAPNCVKGVGSALASGIRSVVVHPLRS